MESSLMKMSVTPCSCIAPQDSSITRQIVASIPQPSLPSSISVTNASTSGSELTRSVFSRSLIALLSCFSLQEILVPVHPAMAFSVGISGPKEWLKNQKKKTSDFLIAPIIASRKRLESAVSFAETASPADIEAAQKLVKSAARDCIKPEDGSLVAFQQKTGVEVCTFRLILKNAASLLDDSDPVKLNASLALDNLISSFTSLNDVLVGLSMNADVNRMAVADAFSETNRALDNFEKGVRECLGIS
ncbi:hypothetical protein KP509_24G066700 [Ceratopteris richardii]|uniref:Uncharacterized protein n=1 Tax=Ceratopteris richardii TaxID=49495 RepID=A0A8T2RY84_CERRI|nr:hypothetical protein KP509_24G066700 [Ceratopteris richardii]